MVMVPVMKVAKHVGSVREPLPIVQKDQGRNGILWLPSIAKPVMSYII